MTDYKGIRTFDELIEKEHGEIGTDSRNEYEEGAQMFIVSEMLKEARKTANSQQTASTISAWHAVGVGDCTNTILENSNITSNTTINGCMIEVVNVNVQNISCLTLDAENETCINANFNVTLGSTLNIK